MRRFVFVLTLFVHQILYSHAVYPGLEYVKVTHPSTGQMGLMFGSHHIVNLQAVLEHLPTMARQQILSSNYLVVENSDDRPVPAIHKKRKKVQKWWRTFEKKPKTLRKILRTISVRQNSKSIKYHTDALVCDLFIWRYQFLMRNFVKEISPAKVIGCVDRQMEQHCRNQGGIVTSLDDNSSEMFFSKGQTKFLYSKKRLRAELLNIKLLTHYVKAARLLKKKTKIKNKMLHTRTKKSRARLKYRMHKIRQTVKTLGRKTKNCAKRLYRNMAKNQRKKYKHISPKKFKLVTSTKAYAGIFMQHVNDYLRPAALAQARPDTRKIVARDQFWHKKMKSHIQTGRNPLFVFGAAHLGNVIKRFQDEGYNVEYMTPANQWRNYPRLY